MDIRKAVITAASRQQRALPLQTFVDRDGQDRSALQIILNEVASAGIDEICIVICPGDQDAYRDGAGAYAANLHLVEQTEERGYGHALQCASEFVGNEAFLHVVNDHLYLSENQQTCAKQVVGLAKREACAVSAVQPTRESMLPYYGTVGARRLARADNEYEIERVIEKPTPTEAEQKLIVPGLRAGHYLCLFGIHVLTSTVMTMLTETASDAGNQSIALSPALDDLAKRERYLAIEVEGSRYNIGVKYGLLMAQLALALHGDDREEVLAQMVEMMAARELTQR